MPIITVIKAMQLNRFELEAGESLMAALLREGYYISAVCGGKGCCGKCRVQVLSGEASVSSEDVRCFSEKELAEGWRLSCTLYPQRELRIALDAREEEGFAAVSAFAAAAAEEGSTSVRNSGKYHIAIDIGTTTMAFQLLEGEGGCVLHTVTRLNHQRKYGGDVVSRIQAAVESKGKVLRESVQQDLREGMDELLAAYARQLPEAERAGGIESAFSVEEIIISCNTTMSHLLMGYDCEGLGVYPFTPVNIDMIRGTAAALFTGTAEAGSPLLPLQYRTARVTILPGISTFVGGDIVSGIYACGLHNSDELCLLIDLGTNGEMVLGNRERLLVTSTAAGPAFEGGNITWGVGSVPGAICSVALPQSEDGEMTSGILLGTDGTKPAGIALQTIGRKPPIGVCGTGVIEGIAELLRQGIVDETGLLAEAYFEEGFPLAYTDSGERIVLTQKDIRELQLAKAAVRAGIETLLFRYGIGVEQVSKVYLAGGFGYSLDVDKAIAIGMLPEAFREKTLAVGNSSLAGAVKYMRDAQGGAALRHIVEVSEEIGLSKDAAFNEYYMDAMMFA